MGAPESNGWSARSNDMIAAGRSGDRRGQSRAPGSVGGVCTPPHHPSYRKLTDDLECRKLILAEARYDKELESPYECAEQTLRTLSSRYRIGVIANQPAGTEERLTKWGLTPFISICLSSTEVGLEKPDPAVFQLALSQSGCKPSQAVMIGDRLDNDIRPARLLGWKTIRIAQGFARFQSPRDGLDEADLTLANVKLVVPVFTGDLAKSS